MATEAKPDLSEFFKLSRPAKPPCRIAYAMGQLDKGEAAQLDAACKTDKGIINTGAIRQWLKARGHDVSIPAITSHRQGVCTCGEED